MSFADIKYDEIKYNKKESDIIKYVAQVIRFKPKSTLKSQIVQLNSFFILKIPPEFLFLSFPLCLWVPMGDRNPRQHFNF